MKSLIKQNPFLIQIRKRNEKKKEEINVLLFCGKNK